MTPGHLALAPARRGRRGRRPASCAEPAPWRPSHDTGCVACKGHVHCVVSSRDETFGHVAGEALINRPGLVWVNGGPAGAYHVTCGRWPPLVSAFANTVSDSGVRDSVLSRSGYQTSALRSSSPRRTVSRSPSRRAKVTQRTRDSSMPSPGTGTPMTTSHLRETRRDLHLRRPRALHGQAPTGGHRAR